MRDVAIIGVGQTAVREHWDRGLRELAAEAVLNALDDADTAKAEMLYVGNMLSFKKLDTPKTVPEPDLVRIEYSYKYGE